MRIGIGYDIHRLVEGRKLILGGVEVPFEKGLLGHSDADVLLHAFADALLGALGERDIGYHFPDSDPKFKGISSLKILSEVTGILNNRKYRIINIDGTIMAEAPRLSDYIETMKAKVATVLNIDKSAIGIKAKTGEGMDSVGRGEAVAAHAAVLLEKS